MPDERRNIKIHDDTFGELNTHRKELDMSWPGYLRHMKATYEARNDESPIEPYAERVENHVTERTYDENDLRVMIRQEVRSVLEDIQSR